MKIGKILTTILIVILGLTGANTANAQQRDNNTLLSKIQAQRVAFFTQKMEITPEEAQKFWPVYNEYSRKKNILVAEKTRLTRFYTANSATMSNNDVELTIKKYIQIAKDETALLDEYNAKFLAILPAHKVMKLYMAEVQFRQWLLQQIRERGLKGDELSE